MKGMMRMQNAVLVKIMALVASAVLPFAYSTSAQATDPKKHISPSASEILASVAENSSQVRNAVSMFIQGAPASMIQPGVTLENLLTGDFRVKLTPEVASKPRRIKIEIFPLASAEGSPLLVDAPAALTSPFFPFVTRARDVMALAYPASTTGMTVGSWRNDSALGLLPLIKKIDRRASYSPNADSILLQCKEKVKSKARHYWFDVIPVNLECHSISPTNLEAGVDFLWLPQYDDDLSTPAVPDHAAFDGAKRVIAGEMIIGAIIQHTLVSIHLDSPTTKVWARNKARCFPAKGFAVRTVLAAQTMPFKEDGAAGKYKYDLVSDMRHPEALYALQDFGKYYGKNAPEESGDIKKGNKYVMFNNRVKEDGTDIEEFPSIKIKGQGVTSSGSLPFRFTPSGTMHFKFNIRDLTHRPGCNFFCNTPSIERMTPMMTPLRGS